MIAALLLAAATATASPTATPTASGAMRTFSGGKINPIHGTPNPLLKEAAPKPNYSATIGPLLNKAAPGSSANPQSQTLRKFAGGAPASKAPAVGMGSMNGGWGWFGLFGVFGLVGLWRRYSGS
jgi:hypothetical protein